MRYFTSILITVAVVALGFVGLSHYVNTAYGQTSSLITVETVPGAGTANGAQILALLNRLNNIALDGSVFKDPKFQSLEDFSISIAPQEVGRPNPYLPVNGVVSVAPVKTVAPKASNPQFLVR